MKLMLFSFFHFLLANPGYNSYLNDSSNPDNYGGDGSIPWMWIIIGGILLYFMFNSNDIDGDSLG